MRWPDDHTRALSPQLPSSDLRGAAGRQKHAPAASAPHAAPAWLVMTWLLQVGVSNLARLAALFQGEQRERFMQRAQQAIGCFADRLRTAALALPQMCAALPGLEGGPAQLHLSSSERPPQRACNDRGMCDSVLCTRACTQAAITCSPAWIVVSRPPVVAIKHTQLSTPAQCGGHAQPERHVCLQASQALHACSLRS